MMQCAQLANSVLAEINVGAVVFVGFVLLVWGTIAISSIKAAAKRPMGVRASPPPLPPATGSLRAPPPLPQANLRGPVTRVGAPLPPLSNLAQRAPVQRPAKTRGVRSGKPTAPVVPTARQGAQVASIVNAIASPARSSISTPAQVRSAVSTWVNIKTLRSEFLLAEALRPPVALRKDPFAPN